MKKIGIISDTHGLLRPEILGILKGCDCIIHAGDVNKPEILDTLRMMGSIYVVRGNNDKDWAEGMAKTLHFTIEGVKFFMTHNKKDVDWDLKDTQVVIFGHTHKYFEKMIDNRPAIFSNSSSDNSFVMFCLISLIIVLLSCKNSNASYLFINIRREFVTLYEEKIIIIRI